MKKTLITISWIWASIIILLLFYKNHPINDFIGKEITWPNNEMKMTNDNRILILIQNTKECSICNMQIYNWYIYNLELQRKKMNCDIVYILSEKHSLDEETKRMLSTYGLKYSFSLETFMKTNITLKNNRYNTFLINQQNKIVLIGSPIDNLELWGLYKKQLSKSL